MIEMLSPGALSERIDLLNNELAASDPTTKAAVCVQEALTRLSRTTEIALWDARVITGEAPAITDAHETEPKRSWVTRVLAVLRGRR